MTRIGLTFDDGYLEHHSLAKVMKGLRIRATFFVITRLDSFEGSPLVTKRAGALREMAEMGHEIGAHTLTHPNLTLLETSEAEDEIAGSKQDLEEILGAKIRGFAYPYGLYNPAVKNIVKKHFDYARTAARQTDGTSDAYEIGVLPFDALGTFSILIRTISPRGRDVVAMLHKPDAGILQSWIKLARRLGAEFVTLQELVEDSS